MQVDLFGMPVTVPKKISTPAPQIGGKKVLHINRKEMWSANTGKRARAVMFLSPEMAEEKRRVTATRSDDFQLEQLEKILGMRPLIEENDIRKDEHGPVFRLYGRNIKGASEFKTLSWDERQSEVCDLLDEARLRLAAAFTVADCWLARKSIQMLTIRFRLARKQECPRAILTLFLEHLLQHDFIDISRSGLTIRSATRTEQMRKLRAARSKGKAGPTSPEKKVQSKALQPKCSDADDELDELEEEDWGHPDEMVEIDLDFDY